MPNFKGARPKQSKFGKLKTEQVPVDPDRLPPIFSFEMMKDGNGYSVNCCDTEHQAAVAKRLFHLSQMTWLQIRQAPRHGAGTEKILRTSIKPALPPNLSEDAEIVALRYKGMHPMVGYRNGRVFYVLLIDHTMDAYPH